MDACVHNFLFDHSGRCAASETNCQTRRKFLFEFLSEANFLSNHNFLHSAHAAYLYFWAIIQKLRVYFSLKIRKSYNDLGMHFNMMILT